MFKLLLTSHIVHSKGLSADKRYAITNAPTFFNVSNFEFTNNRFKKTLIHSVLHTKFTHAIRIIFNEETVLQEINRNIMCTK